MNYSAAGKLLLFGEYLVLKGAQALAIPLSKGQHLHWERVGQPGISWVSEAQGRTWFWARFSSDADILGTNDEKKAERLRRLLRLIFEEQPRLRPDGLSVRTEVDFPIEWGLGTSSTFISLLAQWSGLDPFFLLEQSFGGSGYDVACAVAETPIIFHPESKHAEPVGLSQNVSSKLLFVYSGQKQDSAAEVARFQGKGLEVGAVDRMNALVRRAVACDELPAFERIMEDSELLLSAILDRPAIKQDPDLQGYPYSLKSLGAWGGDFFMATYRDESEARRFFSEAGFPIHFTYHELIKNKHLPNVGNKKN